MVRLTAREIEQINKLNNYTKAMKLGTRISEMEVISGTPVNAVSAGKILTVSGVVIDGEKVTIDNPTVAGSDVYEFLADIAQTKTVPTNKPVDISTYATKASVVLTIDTQPVSGNTMTIGTKVFTFVPAGTATANGEIAIGVDLPTTKINIVAAINGTDSINTPHTLVSAANFVANNCTITALVGGVAGNSIASTETITAGTDIFATATLASGTNCTAANAIIALVSAITTLDTQGISAVDGTGDTVELTAKIGGVAGNNIVIGKVMANATFAGSATKLSGGIDGTVGTINQEMVDATYMYRCVADNTTGGKNWRRISLGSAY